MNARAARPAAFLLLALLVSLRFTADAAAASSETQRKARAHFQAGEERFKAGAFADALAAYQAGYDVLPLPGFLINVAQCQRRLGDLKTARATYQKFVLVAPDSPLVPQVRSMIAEIDGLLADLDKNKPTSGASETARAADQKAADPQKAADLQKAGDDEPATASAPTVPPTAAAAPETAAPVLVAAPSTAEQPAERPRRRWWLWAALGAVVVGGAVTAVVLSTGGSTTIHDGSLGTLRR